MSKVQMMKQGGCKVRIVTKGENTHARWEMVAKGGHEMRMPMQGGKWSHEVDAR